MFSPAVITSKLAQEKHNEVVAAHADVLKGYANQANKIAMRDSQKAAAMVAENAIKAETDKANMAASSEAMRSSNDFALKQAELDIKRSQISAV